MNCERGDLAIVVKSIAGHEGRIVRCIRLAERRELADYLWPDVPVWVLDRELQMANVRGVLLPVWRPLMRDSQLRPIRDPGEDAKDETLSWLPVPSIEKTKETA
jgi:hypothetical protein